MKAEPNVEQLAWAMMAVGEVRRIEEVARQENWKIPSLASWLAAMRIAERLAKRDVRRADAPLAAEVP